MQLTSPPPKGKAASYLGLVLTAAIWGFAFVAQRKGLESLDPFTFNALRFALGALSVALTKRIFQNKPLASKAQEPSSAAKENRSHRVAWQPLLLGVLLFIAASLQQVGMIWTGAGSAGFITGLYVVFVPLFGLFRGQKLRPYICLALVLALGGLWLLNSSAELKATIGNLCVLTGAVFWALHVQMVDKLSKLHSALSLGQVQYTLCAVLSGFAAVALKIFIPGFSSLGSEFLSRISAALIPLLYAGLLSVGVAFTLQIQSQKRVQPHTASVILCLEGVFALLGGWLLLDEKLGILSLAGAGLLLGAMLVSILGEQERFFLIDKKSLRKR